MRRISGQPVTASLNEQTATHAAVLVAQAVLSLVSDGRWAPTPMCGAAYQQAASIMTLSGETPIVSEASIHEARVAAMAEAAHLAIQHLRHDVGAGAVVPGVDLMALLSPHLEEVLVTAYAIVVA
jgi:hypothetical protein